MERNNNMRDFDYKASEANARASLAASPPMAGIWHVQDGTWVEGYPLPPAVVERLEALFVMADRDAALGTTAAS
jgi:hypothetical protein